MRVKEDSKIVLAVKREKANCFGYILFRNCLLIQVIEGKEEGRIQVMEKRGRRCKQLLDECNEKIGHCKLEREALDRTAWRTGFDRGCRSVVRQVKVKVTLVRH